MDPLSIATGIFAVLSSCIHVCQEIQSLKSGAALADAAVQALFFDVEDFSRVLDLVSGTLDGDSDNVQTTGHAGNLWRNVSRSIEKAQMMMAQLKGVLQRVDKNTDLAGGLRKHLRLNAASEEIAVYQQQIRTYRDTLQLSMHSIVVYKQSSLQGTIQTILPSLNLLHRDFQKTQKEILYLQSLVHSQQKESIGDVSNLSDTFKSAAQVISSTSTILTENDDADKLSVVLESITAQSELGDFLDQENEITQRWIFSDNHNQPNQNLEVNASIPNDQQIDRVNRSQRRQIKSISSEVTADLDQMMIQALFHQGKANFLANDFHSAKRLLRRCMLEYQQIPGVEITQVQRYEVIDLLLKILLQQEDWDEAEEILKEQLNGTSDNAFRVNEDTILNYSFKLSRVLYMKNKHVEAKLYGRKALQGYLKLGSDGSAGAEMTLELLIKICISSKDIEDKEAYDAMLAFVHKGVAELSEKKKPIEDRQEPSRPIGAELGLANVEKTHGKNEQTRITREKKSKVTPLPVFHLEIHQSVSIGKAVPDMDDNRGTKAPGITYMDNVEYPGDLKTIGGHEDEFGLFESRRKIVFVGDCCGKSSLILTFLKGAWYPVDFPGFSFFTVHPICREIEDKRMIFEIWDTQSQDDYERPRALCYAGCDVILMCIAIDNFNSLDNVREKFISEVWHFLKGVPIILVGLLKDKRYDSKTIEELDKIKMHPVTFEEGKTLCDQIGAIAYIECSALTGENVSEVFEMAMSVAMQDKTKSRKKKDCLVM